jgi:hypothetical protein
VFRADAGDFGAGQMAVALGPFTKDVDLHDAWVTIAGEGEQSYFGVSSVAVPDLDGDGGDELLVAAPYSYASSSPSGAATVYLFAAMTPGELALDDATVAYAGEMDEDALGVALATADVDQDGTSDLLLGAPFWEQHNTPVGVVYGVDGTAPDTSPEDAPLRIYGDYGGANYFGVNVTALGDIDGDGADDVAVGGGAGGITIFHGPLSGAMLASDGDATVELLTYDMPKGSIASAGDVDGDGVPDLLVGYYRERPVDGKEPGTAWLVNGTRLDSGNTPLLLADWKLEAVAGEERLGYQTASAGDIDGDDRADVLVSAPGDAEWGSQSGAVFFFRGPLSGTDSPGDEDASFHGDASTSAGRSLVPAVDVTGDGLRDVLLGAPGTDGGRGAVLIVPGLAP